MNTSSVIQAKPRPVDTSDYLSCLGQGLSEGDYDAKVYKIVQKYVSYKPLTDEQKQMLDNIAVKGGFHG